MGTLGRARWYFGPSIHLVLLKDYTVTPKLYFPLGLPTQSSRAAGCEPSKEDWPIRAAHIHRPTSVNEIISPGSRISAFTGRLSQTTLQQPATPSSRSASLAQRRLALVQLLPVHTAADCYRTCRNISHHSFEPHSRMLLISTPSSLPIRAIFILFSNTYSVPALSRDYFGFSVSRCR